MLRPVCTAAVLLSAVLAACGGPVVTVAPPAPPMDAGNGLPDLPPLDIPPLDAPPVRDVPPLDASLYCTRDVCCPGTRPLVCNGLCVDPTTDGNHCGGCATACGAGSFCNAGVCVCSAPQTYCPGLGCIDTTVDPAHCGTCGVVCPAGAQCLAGACVLPCATGQHRCAGVCVPDTAVTSCGALCTPCLAPAMGTATCTAGHCSYTCTPGHHPCNLACADDTDVATCGTACTPCPVPSHGHAVCTATGCGAACDPGFHPCGTACLDDTSPASCGTACAPCPGSSHATPTCGAGVCGFTCDTGFHVCNGVCSDGNNPLGCGPSCIACPVPDHGTATCTAGACGFTCLTGYHTCGTTCLGNALPTSCGTLCTPCPVPAHGSATCTGGTCGTVCDRGFAPLGTACAELPRLLGPWNLSTITTARPVFRWNLPSTAGDAVVECCADRACATVLTSFPATGGTGSPTVDLPRGTVFWRVRPLSSSATGPASAVWQLTVTAHTAPVSAAWGTTTDLDGDGYGDVVGGSPFVISPGSRAYVMPGSSMGVRTSSPTVLAAPDDGAQFALALSSAGDVDGDGVGDLLAGAPNYLSGTGRAYVYPGASGGLVTTPATVLTGEAAMANYGAALAGLGDVNGDGYGDIAVGASTAGVGGRVYVYHGTPMGILRSTAAVLDGPDGANSRFGIALAAAGDVNADGYADLLVGADGVGTYTGRAYLYLGSATGLVHTPQATLIPAVGGQFGYAVAGVGDVDGDGYPDVAVGALTAEGGLGRVYVYHGGPAGLDTTPRAVISGPDGAGTQFGAHVAAAGDTNGDGYADFTVGAPLTMGSTGRAYLFRGGATVATVPSASLVGPGTAMAIYGGALGPGRDVNGDGYSDVVVSGERAASFTGLVYVYPGGPTGLGGPTVITGPDGGGRFGYSLARRDAPRVCPTGG